MKGFDPIQDTIIKENETYRYAITACACVVVFFVVSVASTSNYIKQNNLSSTIEPGDDTTTIDPIVTSTQETPLVGESDDYSY